MENEVWRENKKEFTSLCAKSSPVGFSNREMLEIFMELTNISHALFLQMIASYWVVVICRSKV